MNEYFRARKELVDYLFKPTSLAVIERFMETADKQQKQITSLKEQRDYFEQSHLRSLGDINGLDAEINRLKKKRSKGEINEAFAKTIEADKVEISRLKVKVNKLEQKADKKEKELLEANANLVKALNNSLDILDKYANDNPVNSSEYSDFRDKYRALAAKMRGKDFAEGNCIGQVEFREVIKDGN